MSRLKKGMQNIDKIGVAAVRRVLKIDEDVAKKRKSACDSCDFAEPDAYFGGNMCTGKDEQGEQCFCNIDTMVFSNDKKCPLNLW